MYVTPSGWIFYIGFLFFGIQAVHALLFELGGYKRKKKKALGIIEGVVSGSRQRFKKKPSLELQVRYRTEDGQEATGKTNECFRRDHLSRRSDLKAGSETVLYYNPEDPERIIVPVYFNHEGLMLSLVLLAFSFSFLIFAARYTNIPGKNPGTAGRLYFENGWSDALYYDDGTDSQAIVDQKDSASIQEDYNGLTVIADHDYQGFELTRKFEPGETCWIIDENGRRTDYVCVERIGNAKYNDGYPLLPDGQELWDAGYLHGEMAMQTCNDRTRESLTFTFWNKAAP
jgi:hypothetical protein